MAKKHHHQNDIEPPILEKLPQEIRHEISSTAEDQFFPAGTTVFKQGDPGEFFFVVRAGAVRIFREASDRMDIELRRLRAGESFGEMALLTGARRAATVETIQDTTLMVLSKTQFEKILQKYPEMALSVIVQMASWLIENDKMLEVEKRRQYQPAKLSVFDFILVIGVSILCAFIFNHSNPNGLNPFPTVSLNNNITEIMPDAAIAKLKSSHVRFVDARPSGFFNKEHIAGAVNIPPSIFDIMYMMFLSDSDKSQQIIVYGNTLSRKYDVEVANKLFLRGHKNVFILKGDILSWKKEEGMIES